MDYDETTAHSGLCSASRYNHLTEAIKNGYNINAITNNTGDTLLMESVRFCAHECMKLILDLEVDVNATNDEDDTALFIALEHACPLCVKMLCDAGADVNCRNKEGDTPLIRAIETRSYDYSRAFERVCRVIKILIKAGADHALADTDGDTPLLLACSRDMLEVAECLVDAGADASVTGRENMTVLHALCWDEALWDTREHRVELSEELVFKLVDAGGDVNGISHNGNTPLIAAMKTRNTTMLDAMIKSKADLNCGDSNGNTALHIAYDLWWGYRSPYGFYRKERFGQRAISKLISAGASQTIRNYAGRMPGERTLLDILHRNRTRRSRSEIITMNFVIFSFIVIVILAVAYVISDFKRVLELKLANQST